METHIFEFMNLFILIDYVNLRIGILLDFIILSKYVNNIIVLLKMINLRALKKSSTTFLFHMENLSNIFGG